MKELNFNETIGNCDGLVDDLTFSCIVYNVEEGMSWEDVAKLFGEDTMQAAQARIEQMEDTNNG